MAYIFDPLRNTFIDDEDTSLGNKLALLDDDLEKAIREIGEKYGSDTIKTLDQLPENKPQEVEDTEAFNRFNRMYEDGGRVKLFKGGMLADIYSREEFISDIKKGKTLRQIAQDLVDNNKAHFDKIPIKQYDDRGYTRTLDRVTQVINTLEGNISTNLNKGKLPTKFEENKKLQKILEKTKLKNKKQLKNALTDVKNFINKNKNKYSKLINKGETGVPYKFQEDILNFIEKKYPNLISISEGKAGREPVLPGQRLLPITFFGEKGSKLRTTMGGEYARNTNLKRMIFKSLKLPFDLKDGSGVYTATNYNSLVNELLPAAQKKGFVPKFYTDKRGIKRKITASNYNNYVRYNLTDPLFEIFGKKIYFSPEHTGGLKRAVLLKDPQALKQITPMQSFREEGIDYKKSPNLLKGQSLDKKITGQINNAINASDSERPKFIEAANKFSKEATSKFGVPQAIYSYDKKNKKIITKYPNISLNDTLLNKTKAAINNFIANDGINKSIFNELPSKLKKAVTLINKNKNADSILKSHIKDIFPEEGKGIKMGSFAGVIDFDMIPDDLKATVAKGASALGKSLRVLGLATAPLDVFPFSEQSAKGLTGTDLLKTGGAKLIESYLNAPQSIADLFGKKLYEPFTAGTEYADKIEASIPMEERILNQKNLAFDKTMPTFVDDIDIAPSRKDLKKMRKDFVEDVDIDTSENLPFVPLEEKDTELSPIIKSLVAPDQTLQDFMANGGRVNFNGGGAAGADDDFAAQLEYFFLNPDAELPAAQTFKETMNPIEIVNDMIDPRNFPYYADRLVESGIRIGEFGARVLPAVGKLASDLIQKPAFKIKPASGQGYVQDYTDIPPSNITGTGIFSEFLNNLVGTEGTKAITEKTGLAKLIKDEEQKMKDERKTAGAKILADQVTLGMELTAPIFPGLKLLKAYAKNRNLPVDKTTREIMDKEIDEVLTKQGISRRDFMKVAGAGGAVAIAKLLGIGDDLATVTKVAEKTVPKGPIVPNYFFTLVDKIKRLGTDNTKGLATMDREIVYVYKNKGKEYELYEDLTTGSIRINKKLGEPDGFGYKEEEMVYTKGIGDESTKGTPADEYDEFTVTADMDGKMKNIDNGLDDIDDLIEEVGVENITIKDLEAMGYEIDRLPTSVQRKLGIKKPVQFYGARKKSDDDLPDLPF